ncbi:MAG: site-specific integrase [Magnetospirillum sp. WYHS-4]
MATITPRTNREGKLIGWQAKVRIKGFPGQSRVFDTKSAAKEWATDIETQMKRGTFVSRTEAEATTLGEALKRYGEEVTPSKKGARQEASRILRLRGSQLAKYSLANLRSADVAEWRNELVEAGKAPTTIRNLASIISQVYETARCEWNMEGLHNPILGVRMPSLRQGRDRRLADDEEERLLAACRNSGSYWLAPMVILALETAMRQGELLALQWPNVRGRVAHLPDSKNGTSRDVPLSSRARAALDELPRSLDGRVFPVRQDGVVTAFRAATRRAKIEGLRFHDLRHEATSRLFERGWGIMEVASVTGHKTLQMLKRYTHFEAEKLADRLG